MEILLVDNRYRSIIGRLRYQLLQHKLYAKIKSAIWRFSKLIAFSDSLNHVFWSCMFVIDLDFHIGFYI